MTEVVQEEVPENSPVIPPEIPNETVTAPAKVMRIGSMIKQLLDEVHSMTMDGPARERLAEIYERSIVELTEALSPDLAEELRMLSLPFRDGVTPNSGNIVCAATGRKSAIKSNAPIARSSRQ
jgi:hypothetical protein